MSTKFNSKVIRPANTFKKRVGPTQKPRKKFRGVLFLIFVIFVLALFTYVLPTVTVIIVPETENIEKEFEIKLTTDADKINTDNDIFSAQVFEITESKEDKFEATGEKDVGEKASGQAVFYNETGRSQPITTNIDLINDAGIIFAVKENMTIPSAKVDGQGNIVAGEVTIEIESKQAGEKGNVGPGRINISALDLERQSKVHGEIKQGLSGGSSEIVTVISEEDVDNAKSEIIKSLEPEIKEEIKKQAGEETHISDDLIVYSHEIEQEIAVDSEAKNFNIKLNLSAKALVYNNKELRLSLRDKILADLPSGQTIAETEFGSLDIQIENFDIELGMADLKIKASFPVAENIDLEDIKNNIMGKKETEARRYILSIPNIKDVQFNFSLSLRDMIPNKQGRVTVKLGEIK